MVFNGIVEQALLSTGGAEPRNHGLERRTSLEWGHGGHRTAVGEFALKFESWDPLRDLQHNF